MGPAPEPSGRALGSVLGWGAIVLAALVGAALLGAAFVGDGSDSGAILPVGGGAVVLLGAVLVATAFGRLAAPRVGASGAALAFTLLLLVAWTGATVAWSIVPDRSWDAFNRSLAFAA
ncbi:MAG: hypothetical protein H0V68_09960, partial [Actinobacteria bacterium]|nr:hypothetical protein [Actinomycetota bacterium]